MRPSLPVVEFDLPLRHGIGTLAGALGVSGAASLLGWWLDAAPAISEGLRNVLGAAGGMALLPALLLTRRDRPCRLRHGGNGWAMAEGSGSEVPAAWAEGELRVLFDLQIAMLLRFEAANPHWMTRTHWITVRRADLGARWHEWRCAVVAGARTVHRVDSTG